MSETNQNILTREGLLTEEQYSCKYYISDTPLGSYGGYWKQIESEGAYIGMWVDSDGITMQTKAVITINPAKFGISWDNIISAKLKLYGNGACHVQGKGDMYFYRSDYQDIDITDEFSNESASPIQVNIFPIENDSFLLSESGGLGPKIEINYYAETEPEIQSIEIVTPPNKTVYVEGETFDKTGMEVKVNYIDGSYTYADAYTLDKTGELTPEDAYVTVSYGNYTTTQEIVVVDKLEYLDESKSSADYGENPKVNLATGRLLYTMPDISIGAGNYAIQISHVYNSQALDAFKEKFPGIGTNWKLNVQQYVEKIDEKYLYVDGNSYIHNFVLFDAKRNRYNDEEGAGLILTVTSYSCTIEDEAGNKLEFDTKGRLVASVSCENSAIRKVYEYNTEGYLTRVYDTRTLVSGTPREYIKFSYDTNGMLNRIEAIESGVCKQTKYFHYTSDNKRLYGQMIITEEGPKNERLFVSNDDTFNLERIIEAFPRAELKITYDEQNRVQKLSQGISRADTGEYQEKSSLTYTYNESVYGTKVYTSNTEITTNKGITTVYYLSCNGEGVSAFEKVGSQLKTLQKESGKYVQNKGYTVAINGKPYVSDSGTVTLVGEEVDVTRENESSTKSYAATFWLKHLYRTSGVKLQFSYDCNGETKKYTVDVDPYAYNVWQYVSVPVVFDDVKKISNVQVKLYPSNASVGIMSYVADLRFVPNGLNCLYLNATTLAYHLQNYVGVKLTKSDNSTQTLTIAQGVNYVSSRNSYLTLNDIIRSIKNSHCKAYNGGSFDFVYCNGAKYIADVTDIELLDKQGATTEVKTTVVEGMDILMGSYSADDNSVTTNSCSFESNGIRLTTTTTLKTGDKPSSTTQSFTSYSGKKLSETDAYGVTKSYTYNSYGDLLEVKLNANGKEMILQKNTYDQNNEYLTSSGNGYIDTAYTYATPFDLVSEIRQEGDIHKWIYNNRYDNVENVQRLKSGSSVDIRNDYTYENGMVRTILGNHVKYGVQYDALLGSISFSMFDSIEESAAETIIQTNSFHTNGNMDILQKKYYNVGETATDILSKYSDAYGKLDHIEYECDGNLKTVKYEYKAIEESEVIWPITSIIDGVADVIYNYSLNDDNNVCGWSTSDNLKVQQISSSKTKYTFGEDEVYTTEILYDKGKTISPRVDKTKLYNNSEKEVEIISKKYDYDDLGRLKRAGYDYELSDTGEVGPTTKSLHYVNDYTYKKENGNELPLVDTFSFTATREGVNPYEVSGVVDATTTFNQSYEYNSRGNLRKITETCSSFEETGIGATHIPAYTTTTQYDYDNFNRLTSEINEQMNISRYFGYVGNQLRTVKTNGEICYYHYNTRGQLYKRTMGNGETNAETTYFYDNYGNRTGIGYSETELPHTSYEWERGNKLKKITVCSHFYYDYKYNHKGLRSEKVITEFTEEKNRIKYHYDGGKLLGEDRSDSTKIRYFYDLNGICGFSYNGELYTYVKDGLGNVVMIMDRVNDLPVARYYYDALGNHKVLNPEGSINTNVNFIGNINPIRWKSHYYDVESGYYYISGRYYDKEIGKFLDADSIENLVKNIYSVLAVDRNGILCNNIINFPADQYNILLQTYLYADPEEYEPTWIDNVVGWWNDLHWGWKVGIAVSIVVVLAALTFITGGIAGAAAGSAFSASAGFAALGAGFTGTAVVGTSWAATTATIAGAAFAGAAISSSVGFLAGGITFTDGQIGWNINSAANGAVSGAITGAITGGLGSAVSNVGAGLNKAGRMLVQGGLNAAIAGGVTAANGLITGDFSWTSVVVASVFGFGGSLVGLVAGLILNFFEALIGELMEWAESEFNFNFLSVMPYNYA